MIRPPNSMARLYRFSMSPFNGSVYAISRRTLAGNLQRRMLMLLATTAAIFFAHGIGRAQPAPAVTGSSTSPHRLITRDPEYSKLLHAPDADDFVKIYSKGYQDKAAEIDAKVAFITDEKVRAQAREDLWNNVPKKDLTRFQYEAAVALNDARTAFAEKHRDEWIEIGRVNYVEPEKTLVVRSTPDSPVETYLHVPMSPAAMQKIYDAFRQIAGPELDQKAHEYVTKSGADSPCARNFDWCFKLKRDELEQEFRAERLLAVGQGDLERKKIDKYFLVDSETETVLSDLAPQSSPLGGMTWRFSIGPVPPLPVEPEPAAAPPAAESAKVAAPEPAPDQQAETRKKPAAGEAALAPEPAPPAKPERIQIPASVVAASIISQTPPHYPDKARADHISGDVVLHATIDKTGKISEVHAVSGNEALAEAAVEAVRLWRYKPFISDGEPIEVDTTITVTFAILE